MALGPALTNHTEIWVAQTKSGNTDMTDNPLEAAGQTFLKGTPVQLNAAGFAQAWDGVTVNAGILGVTSEDGHNLATAGAGAPGAFTPVAFPGAGLSFGAVPFQPSALNIPEGAPPVFGYIIITEANFDTIFLAQCDNSANNAAVIPTQATIAPGSNQFGMTKDANGHWYIDFAKTTVGTNVVLTVIGFYIDGLIANARLLFQFNKSAMQVVN